MAINSTPLDAAAQSYVSVAEMTAYAVLRPNVAAWTAIAAGTAGEAVLVAACNRLESERYKGTKATSGQRLKWPRYGVLDDDDEEYAADVVPRFIKEAQMELALAVANAGATDFFADTGLEGFDSTSVGPLSVTINHQFMAGQLPATVARLLSSMTRGGGGGPSLVRG